MSRLDVEKMARRFLERDDHFSSVSDGLVANDGEVIVTTPDLMAFARRVALACARVADQVAKDCDAGRAIVMASGAEQAAQAIRAAVRRGRKKG